MRTTLTFTETLAVSQTAKFGMPEFGGDQLINQSINQSIN